MIMKKIITLLAIITLSMTACADRHQTVAYSEIPVQAQAFIEKYFKSSDVAYIERELENLHFEYNVYMKNGAEIEFDHQGNLKSIDCRVSAIPEGIVPEVIAHYVALHYPNHSIVEYVIGYRRITIELATGLELIFDLEGNFLGIDD
jgi:hypothetical protein